jgi:DNA-binding MarR family transcriptional regulator
MPVRPAGERRCVCAALRMATRSVTQLYDNALRPSGLRATQFHILAQIYGSGGANITELTRALVIDQTTLTRSVALLERAGLVKFAAKKDGRVKFVELTAKGLRNLRKAEPLWAAAQKKMLQSIGSGWTTLNMELDRLARETPTTV